MSLPPELAFVFGETENVFHRVRIIGREMIAESTLALTIERPQSFEFSAGDNTMLSIPRINADDLKEFTIASAPSDHDIVLAMRVRNSKFKNACYALKPGDSVTVRSPATGLWRESTAQQIWLSGGVGITPFRGIIRELVHKGAPLAITHIHSDRRHASIPFMQEFESYAATNTGYRFVPTMTREAASGELSGRITADLIMEHAPGYEGCDFFVVGTDAFVASMRQILDTLKVPAEQVRTERFDGYRSSDD